jgi:hypothetical protein
MKPGRRRPVRDVADKGVLKVLRSLHTPEIENGFVHAFRHPKWDDAGIVLDAAAVTCDPEPAGIGRLVAADTAPGSCSAARRAIQADGDVVLFMDTRMGAGRDGLWVLRYLRGGSPLENLWDKRVKGTVLAKPVTGGGWLVVIQGSVLHSLLQHASEDRY